MRHWLRSPPGGCSLFRNSRGDDAGAKSLRLQEALRSVASMSEKVTPALWVYQGMAGRRAARLR